MALISSWATLNTEVMAWLHRPELTAEVPGFIQLGENRIYRDLRVRQMETALSSAISSGVIAVPTGYLEMKYAYVNGSPMVKLQRKDAEWIYQNYPVRSSDGTPKYFAREATNFIFGPYPDSGYTIKGLYYKKLTALSAANTTNWLTDDVPDLILMASLCEAAPWMANDERIPVWERRYALLVDQIQRQDDTEEFSGSPLSMTAR
jgi:hypothetical protein